MPKIPKPGQEPEMTLEEEAITPTGELGSQGADNQDALRRAAESIGLNFDDVKPEEYPFFEALASGELDSLRSTTPEDSLQPIALNENPLIPTDDEEDATTPPTLTPGVTPEAGAEGAEVGLGVTDAPEGTGGGVQDGTAPVAPAPPTPAAPSLVPELIDLGDGLLLSREELRARLEQQNASQQLTPDELQMIALRRQGLVGYQLIDPATGLPVVQQPQQQPYPQQGYPQQQQPIPQQQIPQVPEEWLDPAAFQAYQALQQRMDSGMQQILDNQRALAEAQIAEQTQAMQRIVDETREAFMHSKGMDPSDAAQVQKLDAYLERSGFIMAARNAYPGDPRSALSAAYNAVYGSVPEYQAHEEQRIIARHTEATREVNEKKQQNTAVASSPGTVARTTPAPKTQEERMAAAAAMIEADPQWQGGR